MRSDERVYTYIRTPPCACAVRIIRIFHRKFFHLAVCPHVAYIFHHFLVIQYVAHIHNTVSGVKKLTIIDRVAETTFDRAVITFITVTLFIGRTFACRTAELFGTLKKKNLSRVPRCSVLRRIFIRQRIPRGKKCTLHFYSRLVKLHNFEIPLREFFIPQVA